MKNRLAVRVRKNPQPSIVDLVSVGDAANPAAGSILRMTLPECLDLSGEEIDGLWSVFDQLTVGDLTLPDPSTSSPQSPFLSLDDSLELLISSSMEYLQSLLPDDQLLNDVLTASIDEISKTLGRPLRPRVDMLLAEPFFSGVEQTMPALPLSAVPETQIVTSCFPSRRVRRLSDLLDLSERSLISELGFGPAALRAIRVCWLLREELAWLDALRRVHPRASDSSNLCNEVRLALMASLPRKLGRETNLRVVLRRLGLESGRPLTLEEAAAPFGITRSRAQQIESKIIKALDVACFLEELVPLRLDVCCVVASHGGGIQLEALAGLLTERRGWSEAPSDEALRMVLDCFPECVPGAGENVVLLTHADCLTCPVIGQVADDAVSAGVPVPVAKFRERVVSKAAVSRPDCYACSRHDQTVFEALLSSALAERDELLESDGWILPQALAGQRPSSLAFRAEETLRQSGRCLHFRDIARLLAEAEPTKTPPTPHNVYAALERLPDVISWDAGSFIHKENMPFPYALIRSIEESVTERLQQPSGPPMLSVHGVYELYRRELEAADVPSELALYSLLRISGEPDLLYPRYPQIYLQAGFERRLPLALAVDDFARSAGGVLSLDELREFVIHDMGFKEFQLTQALAQLPGILPVGDGSYLHVDYVRVPERILDKIIHYAEDLVHEAGFVSVQRIYDDLEVDCVVNGIRSSEMLYSLIQLDKRRNLIANHYPLLAHRKDDNACAITVQESIVAYLKEKNAPCSSTELEEEFVDKRRYRGHTVHSAWLHQDVCRYLPGSLIHKATIHWNEVKQQSLEDTAFLFAEECFRAGRYFATIQDLLDRESLPYIGYDLVWTQQLAADLLSRGERCSLLGNTRNAYVTNPNRYGISNLGDLVAQIVRGEYGGGVNLSLLQSRLQEEGVILRSLTQAMLGPDAAVAVVGQEVVLRSLVNA